MYRRRSVDVQRAAMGQPVTAHRVNMAEACELRGDPLQGLHEFDIADAVIEPTGWWTVGDDDVCLEWNQCF